MNDYGFINALVIFILQNVMISRKEKYHEAACVFPGAPDARIGEGERAKAAGQKNRGADGERCSYAQMPGAFS